MANAARSTRGRTGKEGRSKTDPADEARLRSACAGPPEEALSLLATRPAGLDADEVEVRLREHGPNVLVNQARKGTVADLVGRLRDPLVVILLVICAVSFATGDLASGCIVVGMILISVLLSFFQERRSNDAAEKLKLMVQASSAVVRGGKELEIHIGEVVPGDIVVLAAGSIVPADLRVISAKDFLVTQSAFTGESLPVEK
jgi:Mg2+-importing ATPase